MSGHPWAMLGQLGAVLGHFGAMLDRYVGPSCGYVGPSWDYVGHKDHAHQPWDPEPLAPPLALLQLSCKPAWRPGVRQGSRRSALESRAVGTGLALFQIRCRSAWRPKV
eukprot:3058241-Karenia_brevis.AAC.1